MEKEGLARSLQKLDKQGVSINSITTGINKKLSIASEHRNCGSMLLWSRSIMNHLYFVAAASHGDGDLIVWLSLLNHICNQHNGHEGPFTNCVHGPLDNKKWMTRGYVAKLIVDVMARAGATPHKTSSKEIPSETGTFLTDRYKAPSMKSSLLLTGPDFRMAALREHLKLF
ncbi:hypothetical protein HPB49_013708 [Dermacentor silvarum]|uniref:Uncharacterized protein n=1 Tax=Dermacentor silvarum TaxID=543639 RepID=A0ACB8CXF0_DERSI|nr:hypothetical protein HPB49_013708 [Dermacentor silvarum]